MKSFREYLAEGNEKEVINESNVLAIKLKDGNMKISSKEVNDGILEIKISYGNYKCTLITNEDYYDVHSFQGDVATLLNHLIQQFYIDGTVKSK